MQIAAVNGPFGPFSIIGAAALPAASLRCNNGHRGSTARMSRSSTSFLIQVGLEQGTVARYVPVLHRPGRCWLDYRRLPQWPAR